MRFVHVYRSTAFMVALVSLAACGDSSSGDGGGGPPLDFGAVAAEVQAFVDEKPTVDGAGIVIVHRDRGVLYEQSFGAFTNDRVYLLASSSKMITAGVLMRLDDQGVLDVDAPIADILPWPGVDPSLTTAQLLSNSSGLVGLQPNPTYAPYLCQFVYQGSLQRCAQQILTTTADDDLVVPPDTTYRYGGAQWQVAGAVAEVASGKSWAQLVDETYVQPCGTTKLGYNNHFVQFLGSQTGYPEGFQGDPANLLPTDNPNMEGGAYATTSDYAKLLLMHLREGECENGRVLSPEAVRRTHTDRIVTYGGSTGLGFEGYGFGWWVDRDRPSLVIDPGAYGAYAWLDEERGYGVFFALEVNTTIGAELFARLLPITDAIFDTGS
jgi:CubicO group peptidase (beta-lactamase class C family)